MTCAQQYALSPALIQVLTQQCALEQGPPDARLAAGVKKISDAYSDFGRSRALFSDPALRMAYSAYYLPCNAIKLFPVLNEIERRRPLFFTGGTLRVLDLGCGPGTLLLGLLDYLLLHRAQTGIRLDMTGIDRDPGNCSTARALIESLLAETTNNPSAIALNLLTGGLNSLERMSAASPESGFDLIMAGNLINELGSRELADLAGRVTALLKWSGILIVLDPGTRQSFQNLLTFREALLSGPDMHLVAPCLHAGPCPLQGDGDAWCHEKLFWDPPPHVRRIDQLTGFTKHKGLKFSYLVVTRGNPLPADTGHASNNLWRVTSYVIRSKGEERLYVCNGRERLLLRRLTRITAAASADFSCAARGNIVVVSGAEPCKGFMNIGPETVFRTIA